MKILQSKEVDLIISDMKMPEMDGINFLKRIREEGIQIPVIFYSSEIGIEWDYRNLLKTLNATFVQKLGAIKPLIEEINKRLCT